MAHRKWKKNKQPPGTAGPGNMLGCCLISFHFWCDIYLIRPVQICEIPSRLKVFPFLVIKHKGRVDVALLSWPPSLSIPEPLY